MARLCIGAWDIAGTCDVEVMTYAITAHLRRHDTYHSWFDYRSEHEIIRHTLPDPTAIAVVPTDHGEVTAAQVRATILATPDVAQWDCFGFGILQRADHFTVYMAMDHLLTDGMSIGVIFLEIHMMYAALISGAGPLSLPERASYDEYCAEQRRHTDALTAQSPGIRRWIDFAIDNGATLPDFPLPLGDSSVPSTGAMVVVPLMDSAQTAQFEANCAEAGARFSGGVLACAALTEHELTSAPTYYGITPYDTRSTPQQYMTPGWFASFIPVTVPVAGLTFGDIAPAAQRSFDAAKSLGTVPFERALELAPPELGLHNPDRDVPMLSFLDVRTMPLSSEWEKLNAGIFGDSRLSDQVCIWVNRFETGTTLTMSFPENPIARESVTRYIQAAQAAYARAAVPGTVAAAAHQHAQAD